MTRETKKMLEAIEQQNKEYRDQIKTNNKKQEKKERVSKILLVIFALATIVTLLYTNKKMTDNYMNSCQETHTYNYCIEHS